MNACAAACATYTHSSTYDMCHPMHLRTDRCVIAHSSAIDAGHGAYMPIAQHTHTHTARTLRSISPISFTCTIPCRLHHTFFRQHPLTS